MTEKQPECQHTKTHYEPWPGNETIEVCDECGMSRCHWEWDNTDWIMIGDIPKARSELREAIDRIPPPRRIAMRVIKFEVVDVDGFGYTQLQTKDSIDGRGGKVVPIEDVLEFIMELYETARLPESYPVGAVISRAKKLVEKVDPQIIEQEIELRRIEDFIEETLDELI